MKTFKNRFGQVVTVSALGAGSAMAAVPVSVTTAISDAGADAGVIGAAVLVVIVGIYAFKLMRKAL